MTATLLSLRTKQLARMIRTVGWPLSLVAVLVFSGIGFQFLGGLMSMPAWWALPLFMILLSYIHVSRKDLSFLKSIASKTQYYCALSLEYLILATPVILYQFSKYNYLVAIGLIVITVVMTFLPNVSGTQSIRARPLNFGFIPLELYEAKIMLERYWLPAILLWSVCFLGCFHYGFFLLALLFLLTIILGGFAFNEPLELIADKENLLVEKLGINIVFCTLLFLPQLILTLYFHPEAKWILLYGYFYFVIIIALAICYKYSNYSPLRVSTLNANFIAVIMVLSLLPGFILIAIVASVYYYLTAQKRLAYYL